MSLTTPSERRPSHRYLRRPEPLFFPVEEETPETHRHLRLRTVLFDSLREAFGDRAAIGCEQFLYWDARDTAKCCSPDVFVRVGVPHTEFDRWNTWEGGCPQLGVEIVSDSDRPSGPWAEKLERYASAGVVELVRFDPDDADHPLGIWDRVAGDLVERDPADPSFSRCDALDAYWHIEQAPESGRALRLSKDAEGRSVYPTRAERAEQRVRELEAELAKRPPV